MLQGTLLMIPMQNVTTMTIITARITLAVNTAVAVSTTAADVLIKPESLSVVLTKKPVDEPCNQSYYQHADSIRASLVHTNEARFMTTTTTTDASGIRSNSWQKRSQDDMCF